MRNAIRYLVSSASCLTVLTIATPAIAQETDGTVADDQVAGEIIVTATKTGAESLQKVPLAITAFDSEALETRGIQDLGQIATITPGYSFTTNTVWAISSIRGVGTNNVFAGGDPSVTLQVDGVYYGRPTGANVDFMDVERVEVLRGPQGTLYGRNAVAGTANVITRDPGNDFSGTAKITIGDYGLVRPELAIAGPLIEDKLAISVAGRYSRRDGYIKQLNPSLGDNWNENRYSMRGKVRFTPTETVALTIAADYVNADEYYNFATVRLTPPAVPDAFNPGFFEAASNARNAYQVKQWGVSGKLEIDFRDALTLTSITAYRNSKSALGSDLDFTAADTFTTRAFDEDQEQFTQEINLNGESGGLKYILGLFYYNEKAFSFYNATIFDFVFTSKSIDVETKSIAAFAQGEYELTDKLKVTAGLRYTRDTKRTANGAGDTLYVGPLPDDRFFVPAGGQLVPFFRDKSSADAFTPKVSIDYEASNNLLIYGSLTRGFKSGGYNLLVQPTATNIARYDPERVWAYEAGLKATFRGAVRGTFNLAGFYYDYKGLQVQQFDFQGANGVLQFVNNAPAANIKGIEAELSLQPTDYLSVGGALSYLDATYSGSFPAINSLTNGAINPDGNRLSDAPKWSGNFYGELNLPVGDSWDISLRGEGIYKSSVFYSPANVALIGAPSYWLFNLGLKVEVPKSGLELGVRWENIANKKYITGNYFSFSSGAIPGAPRHAMAYLKFDF